MSHILPILQEIDQRTELPPESLGLRRCQVLEAEFVVAADAQ